MHYRRLLLVFAAVVIIGWGVNLSNQRSTPKKTSAPQPQTRVNAAVQPSTSAAQ